MHSPDIATTRTAVSIGRRTLGIGLAASVLAAGAYAYTAANTVADTRAGDGAAAITGYDVSGVQYTLATDPQLIDAVDLDLDAAASVVKVKLDASSAAWTDCSDTGGGTSWTCDFLTDVPVLDADQLAVVATS